MGVLFLVALAGLLVLAVLVYAKVFTSTVDVTLRAGCAPPPSSAPQVDTGAETAADTRATATGCANADTQNQNAGHQLSVLADVKLRGIIVGSVSGISSEGDGAVIRLALDPSKVKDIPRDVSAEIIPKTLFGEKYVNLVIPQGEGESTPRIEAGDVIRQSSTSIEVEQVFENLLPLLQTLQPVQLNMTLSNLAIALQDRGNALGEDLARTDTYFSGLNPDLPNLENDIGGLQDLATNLNKATPDLLADARQFSVNARTLAQKGSVFAGFLSGTKGFADVATRILQQNGQAITALAVDNQPTLALLAEYSPEYPCLLQGLVKDESLLSQAFTPRSKTGQDGIAGLHLNLVVPVGTNPDGSSQLMQPAYTAKDFFDYSILSDNRAYPNPGSRSLPVEPNPDGTPNASVSGPCFGMPNTLPQPIALFPPVNRNDPNYQPAGGSGSGSAQVAQNSSAMALARVLAAPALGVSSDHVSELAALLIAPQISGTTVHAS